MYGVIYKQYTEFYHEFNLGDELNKQLVRLIKGINKLGDDIQVYRKMLLFVHFHIFVLIPKFTGWWFF